MKKRTKERTILDALMAGQSLHRFQAERIGDHCLPSTISALQTKYNLYIDRQRIKVSCRFGSVSVNRYSIPEPERRKMKQRLARTDKGV